MTRNCLVIETCLDTSRHYVDISTHCLHTSWHCLDTLMISLENSLERKKIIWFLYNGLERYVSICIFEHEFLPKLWYSDVNSSLIGWHKMSMNEEWVICCHMWCVYEIGRKIPFPHNRGTS